MRDVAWSFETEGVVWAQRILSFKSTTYGIVSENYRVYGQGYQMVNTAENKGGEVEEEEEGREYCKKRKVKNDCGRQYFRKLFFYLLPFIVVRRLLLTFL